MPGLIVFLRRCGAAGVLGAALLPGAGWAASDTAVVCARSALQEQLRTKYPSVSATLRPLEELGAWAGAGAGVPADAACSVRAVDRALRRQMGVTVELRDTTGRSFARRVTFEVDAHMAAWRLVADTTADAPLRAEQLVSIDTDAIAHQDAIAADATRPPAVWRLRHALPAGHILRQTDVVPANSVLRGDAVSLVYRSGALMLQVQGQALSAAAPGESLRVAVAGQREPVLGLLGDSRLVQVQP